ncbi:MAG: hypothetical protein IJX91_02405 [Clostridia bacterium]|nr:hypothetical protein [Clostridia bacterium]
MKRKTLKKLIVFVCTGNTCRSPMAEAVFRKKAEELGLVKLKVCSAGTHAKKGDKMNEKSAQTLAEKGIEVGDFSSKQIDGKTLERSLAVVCMTDSQRDLLMEMRWKVLREKGEEEIENNVYSFSELAGYEVLDPYGKDIDCYRYVYELIAGAVPVLADKLLPEEIRKKLREAPKKKATAATKKKPSPKKKTPPRKKTTANA